MENPDPSPLNNAVSPGVYRHYKGNYYLVIGIARHSETDEMLVVYVRLYAREGIPISVRPLDNFLSPAEFDGKSVKRFEFVGIAQPS